MDNKRVYQLGQKIRQLYQDEVGGNPKDLVRIWDDGVWYYVVRNDDTQAVLQIRDVAEDRKDNLVAALRQFQPID